MDNATGRCFSREAARCHVIYADMQNCGNDVIYNTLIKVEARESNHISKYPTIKVFRRGVALKSEYRGQRSPAAMEQYVAPASLPLCFPRFLLLLPRPLCCCCCCSIFPSLTPACPPPFKKNSRM